MSVRLSLLAILDQGPCYGYQLRTEFDRRTGSTWPLNVGQIYNTLDRLERDGLVVKGDTDAQGHVFYEITDAGSVEVAAWLGAPVERITSRDELATKLAVAATLPGVDVAAVIDAQRRATQTRVQELRQEASLDAGAESASAPNFVRSLVVDSMLFHAEAEARWLDHAEARLAQHPQHSMSLELATERPKRGRPAR